MVTEELVTEALKEVYDPELHCNIVDLGLVYDLAWDDEQDALVISMTLTSAGCPLTDVIEEQTAQSLDGIVEHSTIWSTTSGRSASSACTAGAVR